MPNISFYLLITFIVLVPAGCFAELVGSAHDFSTANWAGGQICLPCHTPHDGVILENADTAPLWNRRVQATRYRPYSSISLNAITGQPGGVSKLCLSCHDGVTALDSFGERTGAVLLAGDARLGRSPGEHHPISFVFDSSLALEDGDLNDPATTPSGLGGTIATDLLIEGRIECSSCHDVHNRNDSLAYIDTGGGIDGLCFTCHTSGPPGEIRLPESPFSG